MAIARRRVPVPRIAARGAAPAVPAAARAWRRLRRACDARATPALVIYQRILDKRH